MSTARGLSNNDEEVSSIHRLSVSVDKSTSLRKLYCLIQTGLVSQLTNAILNYGRSVLCNQTNECKRTQAQCNHGHQAESLSSHTFDKQKPFSCIRLENTFVLDTTMLQAQVSTLSTESNTMFSGCAVLESSMRIIVGFSKRTYRFLDKIKLLDASLAYRHAETFSNDHGAYAEVPSC